MHACTLMRISLTDLQVKKAIYKAYGVSLLDDLELFSNFQSNYCIVKRDSALWPEIAIKQELNLTSLKLQLIIDK